MSGGEKLFLSLHYASGQYIDECLDAIPHAQHTSHVSRNHTRTLIAIALIAALLTALCAAAYAVGQLFSRGTRERLNADEVQQQELIENGMATVFDIAGNNMSVTVEGVTITPLDVIADSNQAIITFAVDGFTLNAGEEPGFEAVLQDGDSDMNFSGGFVYTQPTDENGNFINDPVYTDENGRLECTLTFYPSREGDSPLGKTARVRFVNLGIAYKVSTAPIVYGEWAFEIPLPHESQTRDCFLDSPVGDTGFVVNKVTLSPLSVYITYFAPIDVQTSGDDLCIPMFEGVVLQDGTRLENIFSGGEEGYSTNTPSSAYAKSGLTLVIDPEAVVSLLFYRSSGDKQNAIEVPLS